MSIAGKHCKYLLSLGDGAEFATAAVEDIRRLEAERDEAVELLRQWRIARRISGDFRRAEASTDVFLNRLDAAPPSTGMTTPTINQEHLDQLAREGRELSRDIAKRMEAMKIPYEPPPSTPSTGTPASPAVRK